MIYHLTQNKRWTGQSIDLPDTSPCPKGGIISATPPPYIGARWAGSAWAAGTPTPTEPAPNLKRVAISERYDQIIEDGLDCTLSSGKTVCVLGRDVPLLGGSAAAAALLVALNPPAAAAVGLHDYLFKDQAPTLTYGELAELGVVYEKERGIRFWAHKRAKDAIDSGAQPDPADLETLGV